MEDSKKEESKKVVGQDSALDRKCRVWASISFAVLLLGVGVPMWWYTTAVPRAAVPFAWIASLEQLDIKMGGRVIVGCFKKEKAQILVEELELKLSGADIYSLNFTYIATTNKKIFNAKTENDLEEIESSFQLGIGDLLLLEVRDPKSHVYVGNGRTIYFSENTDATKLAEVLYNWILRNDALTLTRDALTDPTKFTLDEENRRRFPASPNYDILLTIVNPDPEQLKLNRSLYRIAHDYIQPFADQVSVIADFSVKSQWLYLLSLGVKTKQVPDNSNLKRHFALKEDLLPQIITPLEKKLASHVSQNPTINLVMYLVPCNEAPVYIYDRNGKRRSKNEDYEAFHSPRWGGIVIVNPTEDACQNTKAVFNPLKTKIAAAFLTHLRLFLGVPEPDEITGASVASLTDAKIRGWELDGLLRVRSVEQLTSAKLTLQSLAQLLREISNIVITETVGNRIKNALELIEESAKLLNDGDLKGGFIASKKAFVMSEAAFTDPSLLALLYFPDDQKYAVYIPLFLPVMIPVLFSLKNIRSYFKAEEDN